MKVMCKQIILSSVKPLAYIPVFSTCILICANANICCFSPFLLLPSKNTSSCHTASLPWNSYHQHCLLKPEYPLRLQNLCFTGFLRLTHTVMITLGDYISFRWSSIKVFICLALQICPFPVDSE